VNSLAHGSRRRERLSPSLACNETEEYESMNRSATVLRRAVAVAFIASALSGVAATLAPTASAAPCTASGLASTASGVMADAGAYLAAHPEADRVLTDAGSQPTGDAKASVQSYFMGHPGEFLDLKRIAQPLTDLRAQCGVAVSPGQLAALVESFQ
jgi:hemophore-related protein